MRLDTFDFLSLPEDEAPMTLQVALIAKDGFVIASDTKAFAGGESIAPFSKRHLVLRSAKTRKILISETGNVVVAFSGNQAVQNIAHHLVENLNGIENPVSQNQLESITNALLGNYIPEIRPKGPTLAVVFPHQGALSTLWEVSFYGQAFLTPMTNRLIMGDRANPAIFFVERYCGDEIDKSLDSLTLMAAHMVLEGHPFNPSCVAGLDVVVSRNGEKPTFLDEKELLALCDKSDRIHKLLIDNFQAAGTREA